MDLPEDWEKKALIVVGAIFILAVIYAFNPFQGPPSNDTINQTTTQNIVPFQKNTKTNNSTNSTNSSFKITIEQAKKIANQKFPGYTVSEPIQGSISVNNTNLFVWIIGLSKQDKVSKTIYIDANNGNIVMET